MVFFEYWDPPVGHARELAGSVASVPPPVTSPD
jgi:hypothetical protein